MSDDIKDGMKAWQDATNERLRTWHPAPAAPVPASVRELATKLLDFIDAEGPSAREWEAISSTAEALRTAIASLPAPEAAPTREGRHPIESLWRECGLPEFFLGNDGSNTKLYALYDAIIALKAAPAK